jgi:hypothetical protein
MNIEEALEILIQDVEVKIEGLTESEDNEDRLNDLENLLCYLMDYNN